MNDRKVIYLDDAIDALERKKDKNAKGDIGGFYNKIIQNNIDALVQLPPAQPENVLELGKPYPLKSFEFKIWKDAYGSNWVEIRKYQEP